MITIDECDSKSFWFKWREKSRIVRCFLWVMTKLGLVKGAWHHFCVVSDDEKFEVYMDGERQQGEEAPIIKAIRRSAKCQKQ